MSGHIGLTPVPGDGDIQKFLLDLFYKHEVIVNRTLEDLYDTVQQTRQAGEPDIFAYGKLLNYLASDDVTQPDLIAMCAAVLWDILDMILEVD